MLSHETYLFDISSEKYTDRELVFEGLVFEGGACGGTLRDRSIGPGVDVDTGIGRGVETVAGTYEDAGFAEFMCGVFCAERREEPRADGGTDDTCRAVAGVA